MQPPAKPTKREQELKSLLHQIADRIAVVSARNIRHTRTHEEVSTSGTYRIGMAVALALVFSEPPVDVYRKVPKFEVGKNLFHQKVISAHIAISALADMVAIALGDCGSVGKETATAVKRQALRDIAEHWPIDLDAPHELITAKGRKRGRK